MAETTPEQAGPSRAGAAAGQGASTSAVGDDGNAIPSALINATKFMFSPALSARLNSAANNLAGELGPRNYLDDTKREEMMHELVTSMRCAANSLGKVRSLISDIEREAWRVDAD